MEQAVSSPACYCPIFTWKDIYIYRNIYDIGSLQAYKSLGNWSVSLENAQFHWKFYKSSKVADLGRSLVDVGWLHRTYSMVVSSYTLYLSMAMEETFLFAFLLARL